MSNDLGRTVFVLVALVFLGWFAVGTQLNVRRGNRLLRWLQDGLALVGEKSTLRWLGSSAIELKIQNAVEPLLSAAIFIVLEPRDLPILWWLFRARGRHDLLIVRGELRAPPRVELEALDTRAWSTRGVERALRRKRWTPVAVPPGSPLIAYAPGRTNAVSEVLPLAALPELGLVRLAVHRGAPHVEVQWTLTGLERLEARRVFETVHRLAERF
jgi:hypothetical protein